MFAEPGWSFYGQKRIPRLEADRSLGDERLVCHLDRKFTRLVFTELSSVTQTPRLQRHWKSSVSGRSEADDKTTKSDESARKGALLAPSELPYMAYGAHVAHLHSVLSTL